MHVIFGDTLDICVYDIQMFCMLEVVQEIVDDIYIYDSPNIDKYYTLVIVDYFVKDIRLLSSWQS